ncbi:MAG: methionyl-tRNA formyltransferase [Chloroflexota bacterium]|nr:methionyl-tRNA formyltransferase [Chloroflexota bacterium]
MSSRLVFMGTPDFAVPILVSLLHSPYDVVAAYTQPDKQAGRGRKVVAPPVKKVAVENNIPVIQPETLKSAEAIDRMADFKPALIIVAAFGYILPREILSLPEFGCLNVHPSLLPRHRGPSPIAHTILCGDRTAGVTIMLVNEKVDSGPILARRAEDVSSEDTTGTLTSRLAIVGAELLEETLPQWIEGKIKPQPQDESQATYSKLIRSEEAKIEWRLPAEELCRGIRAYNPWPGCYTWWKGKRLKILEAIPLGDVAEGEVGQVVALPGSVEIGVITKRGVLGLCRVQPEGKRQMAVKDFVRGRRDFIGALLA